VFFESVAERLRRIAARGGLAIVQDPRTAESPIMPRAALKAVPTARTLSLERMTPYLVSLATSEETARPRRKRTGGTDEVHA
jgi:chemotaxis response regulator CheB